MKTFTGPSPAACPPLPPNAGVGSASTVGTASRDRGLGAVVSTRKEATPAVPALPACSVCSALSVGLPSLKRGELNVHFPPLTGTSPATAPSISTRTEPSPSACPPVPPKEGVAVASSAGTGSSVSSGAVVSIVNVTSALKPTSAVPCRATAVYVPSGSDGACTLHSFPVG